MSDAPGHQGAIERIAVLTAAARATWFSFLGILLFVGVTLLGIGDADFFAAERSVDLPLIGVAVPVSLFFLFGAGLTAVIHVYLHVFLEELWPALAAAPPEIGGQPLNSAIAPWLVSSFALGVRGRLRPGEPSAVPRSALGTIGALASFILLYGAAPALLFGLWLRSQPAHLSWLTVTLGLLAIAAAGVSVLSLRALRSAFAPPATGGRGWWLAAGALFAVLIIVPLSLARTVWDPLGADITRHPRESGAITDFANWFRPAIAGLRGQRFTRQAADWLPHDESVEAFARTWCAPRGADCPHKALLDDAFRDAYRRHRHRWLALQEKADFSGRHMDHADLVRAFLPGVTLTDARLRRADMQSAQMEGVIAHQADMTNAILLYTRFDFAQARYARFTGANMGGISAVGADLVSSDLSGATLTEADLRYGILNTAVFSGASLDRAQLAHAGLHRANLDHANLTEADLTGAGLVQTDLTGARLEAARLHRATVSSAKFTNAYLTWALIEDVGRFWFGRTDFSGAKLFGVAFRGIDAGKAVFDGPEQLNWVFGDASVTLPEGMARPCHWPDEVLDDRSFYAHWRGMIEAMSLQRQWESFVPDTYANIRAVALPEDCTLVAFDYEAMLYTSSSETAD